MGFNLAGFFVKKPYSNADDFAKDFGLEIKKTESVDFDEAAYFDYDNQEEASIGLVLDQSGTIFFSNFEIATGKSIHSKSGAETLFFVSNETAMAFFIGLQKDGEMICERQIFDGETKSESGDPIDGLPEDSSDFEFHTICDIASNRLDIHFFEFEEDSPAVRLFI